MKITLDIPDGIIAGFFNGVEVTAHGMQLVSYQLSTDVARAIFVHRNTVLYHLNKVKQQTGLDARRFYDLVELVKMAQEVLENGS